MGASSAAQTLALPLLYEEVRPVAVGYLQSPSAEPTAVVTRQRERLAGWLAALRSRPALAAFVKSVRAGGRTTLGKLFLAYLTAFRSLRHLELSVQCLKTTLTPHLADRDRARITSLALTDLWELDAATGPAFDLGATLCAFLDLSRIESVAISNWWKRDSAIFSWLLSLPPRLKAIRMREADVFWTDLVSLIVRHGWSLLSLHVLAEIACWVDDPPTPDELPSLAQACPRLRRLGWDALMHEYNDPDDVDDNGDIWPSELVLAQLLWAGHPTLEEITLKHQSPTTSHDFPCDLLADVIADAMDRAPGSLPSLRRLTLLSDSFAEYNLGMESKTGLERLHTHGLEIVDGAGEQWSPSSPCMTLGIASLFEL